MTRTLLVSLMLGVAAVAGCGGKDASGPKVVAGAAAGKVTAVQGTVIAVRGEVRRPLALGDAVSGDDVIDTGVDGRVTIVLDHNQVPFSLGPERKQVVSASPAWSAPRGTSVAVTSTDRSGAAGRHAEREAADTLASAPSAPPAPSAAAPAMPAPAPSAAAPAMEPAAPAAAEEPARPKRARAAAADEPPAPPPPPPDSPAPGGGASGGGASGGGGGAAGGGSATADSDPGATSADEEAAGGAERRIVGQQEKGAPVRSLSVTAGDATAAVRLVASIDSVDTSGGLAADVVVPKVRSRGLSLRECAGAKPAATRFDLVLTVAPSGAVSAASASGGTADVHACLAGVLRKLVFPAAATATTARLRLELLAR